MNWIKVISLNIFITFSLIGMVLTTPPLVYSIYSMKSKNIKDNESILHIYNDFPWYEDYQSEANKINTTYYDYITWRRDDFEGKTINISNGLRVTAAPKKRNGNISDYYFFGGSTTWGTGVNDANTYPSIFAERLETQVINFGETGYIARQSLAFLNNFLITNSISDLSEQHIIFYDGVNDIVSRCRSESSGLSTSRGNQIQNILSNNTSSRYTFGRLFEQVTSFLQSVSRKLSKKSPTLVAKNTYNCSSNPNRAEEVARTLVGTWQVASNLVTQLGGNFTAILQPVAFFGSPNVDYLKLTSSNDLALSMQYEAVYPLIRQFAAEKNINFIDLSLVYDNCENCYIDFCHVGPQAHQILVDSLVIKLST